MTRFLSLACWLVSAAIAIAFALWWGFYGWAAILIWTVLVLPCTLHLRRQLNGEWPSVTIVRLWAIAITMNLAAGILPPVLSVLTLPDTIGSVVGWVLVTVIWSGLVAAVLLLTAVTGSAIRHSLSRSPSAA